MNGIQVSVVCNIRVSSQCIQAKTLKKPSGVMSVVTKLALQIQCKLGGELWKVVTQKVCLSVKCDIFN